MRARCGMRRALSIPATWSICAATATTFVGRREGIINVGGRKVHPEAVEAVINQHPAVRMSRVSGRSSPITGAIVVAEVVVASIAPGAPSFAAVKDEILGLCRDRLAAHEVPVTLRQVASLDIAASGKLVRHMHNVVVTGGSRGLGLGIAQKLAASGFQVVAIARRNRPPSWQRPWRRPKTEARVRFISGRST